MKNYVILLAGGVGKRMGADIPKQFLMVKGKPIIVHTIERFQENSQIDKIVVVCVKEWKDYVEGLVKEYELYGLLRAVALDMILFETESFF